MILSEEVKNYLENKELCQENPESFMICPRCVGTKFLHEYQPNHVLKLCNYCNGDGVITWIDRIVRNMKNPFTEETK